MLRVSMQKEKEAILKQNYIESDMESLNQQLILKLAFLELCGWLETTLDEIYLSVGKTIKEKEFIERHINSCYGFKQQNFTSCIKYCLGDDKYNTLKNGYDSSTHNKKQKNDFLNKLETLSKIRNEYAHTCYQIGVLQGGQPGINDIQQDFIFLLKILTNLYNDLNNI